MKDEERDSVIEECAKVIEAALSYDEYDPNKYFADLIREIKTSRANFEVAIMDTIKQLNQEPYERIIAEVENDIET